MKSLPIALDRLLLNPSYERIEGKLLKVAEDASRIILELKDKKLKTLLGPFPVTDWASLENRTVIAFLKAGEQTRVYDCKAIPKADRASSSAAPAPKRASLKSRSEPKDFSPKAKWKKFAEGRMIGKPVKLTSMEKGFGLDIPLLESICRHLEIPVGQNTGVVAYLDFRRIFHFISSPEFKAFKGS
ncbi:MAG: hypothetical protein RLZZ165_742 [Bacteroidota bacterium]|jgi:hypothetical protein